LRSKNCLNIEVKDGEEMTKLVISMVFVFMLLITGCSSTIELTSTPVPAGINVNGNAADWGTDLKYIKDENAAVGISNDNNYFYLCLTTSDMSKVMPMFVGGFTVWLENESGNGDVIGVKYPLHNIVNESRVMVNPGEFREGNRGMMISKMIKNQDEIRILNKDNYPVTVISTSDSSGLKAAIGYSSDQFIYELRVPLKVDQQNKYGINARQGDKILVKLETDKPDRGNFGGGREGGMRAPGGEMGGGFPGGGGRGMRPGGGGRGSFEPVDFSIEVTLQ
jgi:hypothetical protein